jgi:hypothetical protein
MKLMVKRSGKTQMRLGAPILLQKRECPKISVKIGGVEVLAILDTECELTIMNENLYERVRQQESKGGIQQETIETVQNRR